MNLATYEDYEYLYTATGESVDLFTQAKRLPPAELIEARSYIRETIDMKLRDDDERARETEIRLTQAQNALDTWGRGDILRDAIKHVTDSVQSLPDEPEVPCPACGHPGHLSAFHGPAVEKTVWSRDSIGESDGALVNEPGAIEQIDARFNRETRLSNALWRALSKIYAIPPFEDTPEWYAALDAQDTADNVPVDEGGMQTASTEQQLPNPLPVPNPDEKHPDAPHDGEPGLVYPSFDEHQAAFASGLQAYAPDPVDYPNTAPGAANSRPLTPAERMAARIAAAREIPPAVTNVGNGPETQQQTCDGSEV